MGHGLGAVRELGLDAYAVRFAEAGFAVMPFTYRHFGDSEGVPRQLLDIGRQHGDWFAALRFARSLPGVDADRVAIWGSSFGGGHAIEIAAADHAVAAAVAQCPFTDGPSSVRALGLRSALKLTPRLALDLLAAATGRPSAVLAPAVGRPGDGAFMTAPDAEPGYLALVPSGFGFVNGVAARAIPRLATYRPGRAAKRVRCPILYCVCDADSVAPSARTVAYAAQSPRGEIRRYPTGHFDIYVGDAFERAVADQVEFFARHLVGHHAKGA
jgi:fermentation-respiration switch protein FrsA (DUF1100 family)